MSSGTQQTSDLPRRVEVGSEEVEFRLMTRQDKDAMLEFARALPRHDLLFLRRDITQPEVVEAWGDEIEQGILSTILAVAGDGSRVLGYATLHRSDLRWSAHVAELRIAVAEETRRSGLGRLLTQEIFRRALELGVEKMVARMTLDQKGAISVFESLGFRPEALMRDHVKDLDGRAHDLVVMSLAVAEFHNTLDAYGVSEALT